MNHSAGENSQEDTKKRETWSLGVFELASDRLKVMIKEKITTQQNEAWVER